MGRQANIQCHIASLTGTYKSKVRTNNKNICRASLTSLQSAQQVKPLRHPFNSLLFTRICTGPKNQYCQVPFHSGKSLAQLILFRPYVCCRQRVCARAVIRISTHNRPRGTQLCPQSSPEDNVFILPIMPLQLSHGYAQLHSHEIYIGPFCPEYKQVYVAVFR